MDMLRPSNLGNTSTRPTWATASATLSRMRRPSWGCCISRPRNMIVTLTLLPSPRNASTLRVLVAKSPGPIFGRYFISLTRTWVDFRRDSLARWDCSYLNFP